MVDSIIENIVVTAQLNQQLPLQTLSVAISNTEYDEQDPVLIFRFDHPKRAVIVTEQGIISCTGVTSLHQGEETIYSAIDTLKQQAIPILEYPPVTMQSFILTVPLETTLDLDHISRHLPPDQVIYKPNKNPWIEYLYDDQVTMLICASGLIICTGTSPLDHAYHAIDMLSTIDGIAENEFK